MPQRRNLRSIPLWSVHYFADPTGATVSVCNRIRVTLAERLEPEVFEAVSELRARARRRAVEIALERGWGEEAVVEDRG